MAGVRILDGVRAWLSRTLTRKFLLLMAGFLTLQAVQVATGVVQTLHVGEEAAAINDAGRQRMRTLLLGSLVQQAVETGAWDADQHRLFRESIQAADAYFRRHDGTRDRGEGRYRPIEELRGLTRADWQEKLRPLLQAAKQAADPAAARHATDHYQGLVREKLRRLDQVVALMEEEVREESRTLAMVQAATLAVSLLLGLAGLVMALRIVSRPLRHLIEAANAIAAGAYERRVPVASRDELGELAETFNRMAAAVGEQTSCLRALSQAAAAVTSSLSLKDILDEIMRHGVLLTGSRAACVALHDARTGGFRDWVTFGLSAGFVKNMAFRPGGLAGEVFARAETVLSDDRPGTRHKLSALARAEGIRCLVCLPLVSHADRLGVVYFYRDDRDEYAADEIQMLRTFASLAAGAIANARLHEETLDLAITDKLTGLRNRRLFDQHLSDETARSRRDGRPLALLLADIDHFKRVNDTYGHATGDQVLQAVSRLLMAQSRQVDLAARFGGEEFALILPDTDGEGARLAAERIRRAVANEPLRLAGGREVVVTLSIGIGIHARGADTPEKLIERADQALYTAKREGRNRVCLYEDTLKAQLEQDPSRLVALLERGADGIPAIVTALSAKAGFFRSHSEAVTDAALRLAGALGLPAAEREALRLAGLLHDMGMIAVPDEVLNKRDGLSAGELGEVKAHAAIGADFLERVPALRHLAPIVRHHHERFDGGGYPDGLRGEAIPYLARVLAVADAYGSVVGGWAGRTAQPEAQALEVVRAGAGTQFDPLIVAGLVAPRRALDLAA